MLLVIVLGLAFQPSPAMLRQLFEQALERRKADYGESDIRTGAAARDLALFHVKQGDLSAARTALAETLRLSEKIHGLSARRTLADAAELAAISPAAEAVPLWNRAASSPEAEVASRALAALGSVREAARDRTGAARFYRQALDREEASSGPESPRVAVRLNALSRVVEPTEGIQLLERALSINVARLGAKHVETGTISANLAGMLLGAGRAERAVALSREAVAIFEHAFGPQDTRTSVARTIHEEAVRQLNAR